MPKYDRLKKGAVAKKAVGKGLQAVDAEVDKGEGAHGVENACFERRHARIFDLEVAKHGEVGECGRVKTAEAAPVEVRKEQ